MHPSLDPQRFPDGMRVPVNIDRHEIDPRRQTRPGDDVVDILRCYYAVDDLQLST